MPTGEQVRREIPVRIEEARVGSAPLSSAIEASDRPSKEADQ
jgi:hypothetical protein